VSYQVKSRPRATPTPPAERDTRPVVSRARILAAVPAAAAAATEALATDGRPRFAGHEAWGRLRRLFHVLPDPVRREVVVRLVLEEADRIEHEQANAWGPSDRTARTAHASGG
jgi:hypothetical protein